MCRKMRQHLWERLTQETNRQPKMSQQELPSAIQHYIEMAMTVQVPDQCQLQESLGHRWSSHWKTTPKRLSDIPSGQLACTGTIWLLVIRKSLIHLTWEVKGWSCHYTQASIPHLVGRYKNGSNFITQFTW